VTDLSDAMNDGWVCDSCGWRSPGQPCPDSCPACDVGPLGSWTGYVERTAILDLLALQRQHNHWLRTATRAERTASAKALLRHIGETEDDAPEWYRDV
jgi:hypothetical protein